MPTHHQQSHGFTLIELMVVMVIVAILGTVAYPSYGQYLLRTHRADAQNQLLQAAQWMERSATAIGAYPTHALYAAAITSTQDQLSNARYAIAIQSTDGASFTASATPLSAQSKDLCGTLHLSHAGERSISNLPAKSTMTALQCWGR